MPKSPAAKPARKRPTRKQLDERLAIPLGADAQDSKAPSSKSAAETEAELAASRQRVRDRAGDEPPPKGTGRPRK